MFGEGALRANGEKSYRRLTYRGGYRTNRANAANSLQLMTGANKANTARKWSAGSCAVFV